MKSLANEAKMSENLLRNLPSASALAYLGDAEHDLYVRSMLVRRGLSRSKDLNFEARKYVTAEAQALLFERIKDVLSVEELATFRRAFNSTHLNKPKHSTGKEYRTATGFEAVLGMLSFIGERDRLRFLLDEAHKEIDDDTEN